jgi:hypothetical protein
LWLWRLSDERDQIVDDAYLPIDHKELLLDYLQQRLNFQVVAVRHVTLAA